MNFAVFVSGSGTNLQAIIRATAQRKIRAALALVFSDNPGAYALKRAKRAGLKTVVLDPKGFLDRESFDREAVRILNREQIDFVVLAGFMRILSPYFVKKFKGKLINIHPSLLPSFKGTRAIADAFASGVKVTGVTVHFVDEKVDHGPIIVQAPVAIRPSDTLQSLQARIHRVEHQLYPRAVDLLSRNKLIIRGAKVLVR